MEDWTPAQLQQHLDAGGDVFLKLWKPGCGACKLSKPAVARLEAEYGERCAFVQINTQAHPEMLEIADTEVLPVFFVMRSQKLAGKHIGFKGLQALKTWMAQTF